MGITYGGYSCLDPRSVGESCLRLGLPTGWLSYRANSYTNPLGCRHGTGWLLLTRGTLDDLDQTAGHDLTFSLSKKESNLGESFSVTHKNLHIVGATCLTPGLRGDRNAAYLVEIADRRRRANMVPKATRSTGETAYNVRINYPTIWYMGGADYYSDTLNVVTPWTWTEMVENLWNSHGSTVARLGDYPGLPFTPHGTPENFYFDGWLFMDALAAVLERLGCALKLDTLTDTYSIVRLCASDTQHDAALVARDRLRVWDDDPVLPVYVRHPQYLRVYFARRRGGGYDYMDATDPSGQATGVEADTYAVAYDDLTALTNEAGAIGSSDNFATLQARADERATDFFRRLRAGRLRRVYAAPLSDAGLMPGSMVTSVRWADTGNGMTTEVVRRLGPVPDGGVGSENGYHEPRGPWSLDTTNLWLGGTPGYALAYAYNPAQAARLMAGYAPWTQGLQIQQITSTAAYTSAVLAFDDDQFTLNYSGYYEAQVELTLPMTVTSDTDGVKLVNDASTPGNSKYYGTDAGGTKGWHSLTLSLTVGSTAISGGVSGDFLYNNSGTLGSTSVLDGGTW